MNMKKRFIYWWQLFLYGISFHRQGLARRLGTTGSIKYLAAFMICCGGLSQAFGCTVLRLMPTNDLKNAFVNTLISVTYKADSPKQCTELALRDASNNIIPLKILHRTEWQSPVAGVPGVIGLISAEPTQPLQANQTYKVWLQNEQRGTFETGSSDNLAGKVINVADQTIDFADFRDTAVLTVEMLNRVVDAYANNLAGGNPLVAGIIKHIFKNLAPPLSEYKAHYNAHIKRLTYLSYGADGSPITLSGLLVLPENPDGTPFDYRQASVVLHAHGSTSEGGEPSLAKSADVVFGGLLSGHGKIFVAPDGLGLGTSASIPQAYIEAPDSAIANRNMMLAVYNYFKGMVSSTNPVYLVGASQGAYTSFATLPYLDQPEQVLGIYGEDGPYNVFGTFNDVIRVTAGGSTEQYPYAKYENLKLAPSRLKALAEGYKYYQNLAYDPADFFDGDHFSAGFLQRYAQNQYPELMFLMGLNSVMPGDQAGYQAQNADVILFHYPTDILVPAQNTEDMLAALKTTGGFKSVDRGECNQNDPTVKMVVQSVMKRNPESLITHTICGVFWLSKIIEKTS